LASISNDPNGRRRILFVAPDGSRKTIRLGKIDRKGAEAINRHVEALLSAKIGGQPIPRDTAAWITDIGEELIEKLSAVGLLEAPRREVLGEFLRNYILNRGDVKPATVEVWEQPCRNLITFFGDDKPLKNITPGDAEQFSQWITTQPLASTTIAKWLTFCRTFFHVARKHRMIEENPFAEVKIPNTDVTARQAFVARETVAKILGLASAEWRTIIALSRYGGLRCPSEVLSLEWKHVNFETNKIQVPSPKTERYAGKASRLVPMFPELRPFLEAAKNAAAPGQTYVIGGGHLAKADSPTGWKGCNLRTAFLRLVKRAGLKPWPKLFHNLRSSRETELLDSFPVQVVSKWMGHDAKTCLAHYAQTTDDHFRRAVGGAESGALEAQNPAQQVPVSRSGVPHAGTKNPCSTGGNAVPYDTVRHGVQNLSGEGGIRTLVTLSGKLVFETNAIDHSATSPVMSCCINRDDGC